MRIQLPQAIKSPDIVAIEIPANQTKYNQEDGAWTFQVFGVSADGDVSTLKVQALNGEIKRFETETVSDSEIDTFLSTPQGAGQDRTHATLSIALGKLYAFALAPISVPATEPATEPATDALPEQPQTPESISEE